MEDNHKVEMSAPGDRALGSAIWQLLDQGFVVTLTPSKKGPRSGGFTVTVKHRSGRYRNLEAVTVNLFTQPSPKARRLTGTAVPGGAANSAKRN